MFLTSHQGTTPKIIHVDCMVITLIGMDREVIIKLIACNRHTLEISTLLLGNHLRSDSYVTNGIT
jgi:hypothetical protein